MTNKKVLIFISHYLPGYKMGGPINSVFNITNKLKDEYDFYIITSDHDLGSTDPYPNIMTDEWLRVYGSNVMYKRLKFRYYIDIIKHLNENSYDMIYLNSFFDFKFSIFIVLIKYCSFAKIGNIIVAPRGELFQEALSFGKLKKSITIKIFRLLNIYKSIIWHSTSSFESLSISENISKPEIRLARVISDFSKEIYEIPKPTFQMETKDFLKVIFLSRISKDKNIVYAIRLLAKITCFVEFHIYGPIEDEFIWKECVEQIKLLPDNIKVQYKGKVEKKLVKSYFSKYDLFLFPTHRENFGHVISESLSVGTPVLISDNTPWRDLEKKKLGWDVNLNNECEFIEVISSYFKKSEKEKQDFRETVIKSYLENLDQENILRENINLFRAHGK